MEEKEEGKRISLKDFLALFKKKTMRKKRTKQFFQLEVRSNTET